MSEMRLIDANALEPDTEWNGYYDEYVSYSQILIDNAPTVDAVPVVHGHWEICEAKNGESIEYKRRCSICHTAKPFEISPYCCGCGARMDEENMNEESAE